MLRFHVPAMTCGGCARSITRALQVLDPSARIETDPPARELRFSGSATASAVIAALVAEGYPAVER